MLKVTWNPNCIDEFIVPEGYRLVQKGERHETGDLYVYKNIWEPIVPEHEGMKVFEHGIYIRKIT